MATIQKRGGSFKIIVSCGYSVDGKQIRQTMTYKPAEGMTPKQIEKEVNRQAVLFEQECQKGQITASVKFESYATEYLTDIAPLRLKPGTISNYRNYARRVFKAIGHMRLDKITAREIQKLITDMKDGERLDRYRQGKPLSAKTIKNHVAFISSIYEYAKKMQVISYNPCETVTLPKDEEQEIEIYSIEETQEILSLLYQEPLKNLHYTVYFMLAFYTGFRRGEILGLEWKDIDFERQIISLRRASLYTKDKGTFTSSLKTRTSYRTLKLPPEIISVLGEYKAHQTAYIKSLGDKWVDVINGLDDKPTVNDRLFTQYYGKPMHPNAPALFFGRFCKRNGFTYRKIHSLRHLNTMKKYKYIFSLYNIA